ncbi:MAG: hypothetical protein LBT86_01325 [Deltaproteobacteria bacterium]|jgi:TPR repeat protein|nr:hypothetical protein [Deltaproteobacteria bacterium]
MLLNYFNGFPGPKNLIAAEKYFRQAAEVGHLSARLGLGDPRLLGEGVGEI